MKRKGVTVVLPGGGSRNFPTCGWIKPEQDVHGHIIRTRLSNKRDGNVLAFAPPQALIVVHWKSSE